MKIMVRIHDLGKNNPKDLAHQARMIGFDGAQLVLYKAIDGFTGTAHSIDYKALEECAKEFKNEGVEVGMLGAYFNPVHSNKELVKDNIERFKEYLSYCSMFNCKYVGSETGSFNDDKWTYNPLNRTQDALNTNIETFKELADVAKAWNANIALEGAYGHCMYEPAQLNKLISAIDNGHVKVTVDIFNYLDISAYDVETQHKMLDESIKYFKDKIVIYHLKDFVVDTENNKLKQVGLGEGIMDLEYIISTAKRETPNALLVFEGCPKDKMQSSYDYIKKLLNE
ncbi:MAG: sugar phosphate isomerase/epimerase [Acholeplasmatales bacterium]|nr:sugar phosphate isomerase/epimerase [Acholeplasmatales bacterium]